MPAYSAETIQAAVEPHRKRFLTKWGEGRPEGWTPSPALRDTLCIGMWLDEELTRIGANDDDRRTQTARFNRESRSELGSLWDLAADIMNQAVTGDVPQNRKPHHRWG